MKLLASQILQAYKRQQLGCILEEDVRSKLTTIVTYFAVITACTYFSKVDFLDWQLS